MWVAVGWLHVVEPALSGPWVRAGRGGMGRAMWGEAASPLRPLLPPLLHGSQQVVATWVLLQVPL